MIRAVLFDFNGVLVDDEPIHQAVLERALAEEGIAMAAAEYVPLYLGRDDRTCFATALGRAGQPADPARIMRLVARKAAYYRQRVRRDGYPPAPGAAELVHAAAAAGWMLGVVSGALREEVEEGLAQVGLRSCFKMLVTAEDVEAGKPDPQPYQRGLELLNSLPPLPSRLLHPHEVLAVEDSRAGLESAAAVGLVTLAVAQSCPAAELAGADRLVASLATLSVERLQELFAEVSRS